MSFSTSKRCVTLFKQCSVISIPHYYLNGSVSTATLPEGMLTYTSLVIPHISYYCSVIYILVFIFVLDNDEFRVLDLRSQKTREMRSKKRKFQPVFPPRYKKMSVDQDWSNVWPGPRTFHPATVPLPLRQGINKLGAAPDKFANTELMKIPNFLHLTPPAIKKHCRALKQFCTPWPKALSTDADCKKHFPLEVIQTDYCHSSPSIRNPLARIVTIKVSPQILFMTLNNVLKTTTRKTDSIGKNIVIWLVSQSHIIHIYILRFGHQTKAIFNI